MACEIVQNDCKRAGERKRFPSFEWVDLFARKWGPNQPFDDGVCVRPLDRAPTGLEYQSSGGVSAGREPKRWPTVAGGTVVDGDITWTARAVSYDSLVYRIEDVAYEVPNGITVHELPFIDEPAAQRVRLEVSGGTAGQEYDILVRVTTSEAGGSRQIREAILRLEIE